MGLQWGDVRGNQLKLRDSKTGPRVVWLGDEARALIDALPRNSKVPWLFWKQKWRKRLRFVDHYWREFQAPAGLRNVRLHDLRHTFASHAAMSKETLPMIGRLLGTGIRSLRLATLILMTSICSMPQSRSALPSSGC